MRILGVVPARAGSKGIPNKNIRPLAGRPVIEYTIEAALESEALTDVIVSTEDDVIATIARRVGAEVPFMRSAELAQDTSPTFPVVRNALEEMKRFGREYDAVCLMQPTSPLRSPDDVKRAVELMKATDADSVISMSEIPHEFNPHWAFQLKSDGTVRLFSGDDQPVPRRQELPKALYRNGLIYLSTVKAIEMNENLYGVRTVPLIIDAARCVNLDTEDDWALLEGRIRSGEVKLKEARYAS